MDGHARCLARDVPQRDVTGAQAFIESPRLPLRIGSLLHSLSRSNGLRSHDLRLEHVENRAELAVSAAPEVADEAVALDALIGQYPQHALFDVAGEAAEVGVQPGIGQRAADDFDSDVGDLHSAVPPA